jgi:hypothetical protein
MFQNNLQGKLQAFFKQLLTFFTLLFCFFRQDLLPVFPLNSPVSSTGQAPNPEISHSQA